MSTIGADLATDSPGWTFLTNHSHVLICITEDQSARARDIAASVGITERAVQRIVTELCDAGYVTKVREGRRNRYTVHLDRPLRHPVEGHCTVSELLKTVRRQPVPTRNG
jgi:Mn-dependent DtxR family transcriptional regulator